jgi:hypothetical protein
MNGEEGSQLQKIYDSVIRLEEMMKTVKEWRADKRHLRYYLCCCGYINNGYYIFDY